MTDPTLRFSSRVDNYIQYRPHYPAQIIDTLRQDCQLTPASVVADIGSGTGILTELFLRNGSQVFAVEPNREMREAGERLLKDYPLFHSIPGTAEDTLLSDGSVDFVTVGQAFHWFDREKARAEFRRVLKPDGWVVLVWNDRQTDTTPFLRAYEQLLARYGTDYRQVDHKQIDEQALRDFYGTGTGIIMPAIASKTWPNAQAFDYEGLKGRLLSSSYTPQAGQPDFEPMLAALSEVFQRYQRDGRVSFDYTTIMYYGHFG
ncbi:MAG: class I SAM-dependent methyltransferase [Thermoflexales bacterium]|nr:class I SAM-dependent methyltransferase [Thermoflexales bacterium]